MGRGSKATRGTTALSSPSIFLPRLLSAALTPLVLLPLSLALYHELIPSSCILDPATSEKPSPMTAWGLGGGTSSHSHSPLAAHIHSEFEASLNWIAILCLRKDSLLLPRNRAHSLIHASQVLYCWAVYIPMPTPMDTGDWAQGIYPNPQPFFYFETGSCWLTRWPRLGLNL